MLFFEALRRQAATREDRIVLAIIAGLLVILGYGVGFWSAKAQRETPIVFQSSAPGSRKDGVLTDEDLRALTSPTPSEKSLPAEHASGNVKGAFVASSNGTKYYTPDCSNVARIQEENRVWFESESDAKQAGYDPSSCVLQAKKQE